MKDHSRCKLSDTEIETLGKAFTTEATTIRKLAKQSKISKSTMHNYLSKNLQNINPILATEVSSLLNANFDEKHIRGGEATKKHYKGE